VHELGCADDRIDRAGVAAMKAADASWLVDDSDGRSDSFCQRNDFFAEQAREPTNCVIATGRT
jgi:hypothetical protein